MQNRIKPPVLISRLMMFVFASSLVVLFALLVTLYNMFPLERPQVFFLRSHTSNIDHISITDFNKMDIDNKMRYFIRNFIFEYIKARNEIVPSISSMRAKWTNNSNGEVYSWSTTKVYNEFATTELWNEVMRGDGKDFDFSCPVDFFRNTPPQSRGNNEYEVSFYFFCKNNDGQLGGEQYKVRIKLDIDDAKMKWSDRLENPLGIRVSEYEIIEGEGDPLDMKWLSKKERKEL